MKEEVKCRDPEQDDMTAPDLDNWVYHVEITQVFSKEGELLKYSGSVIPGEYEPDEMTKKYWAWLDERRSKL